jgi:hypothetical protein
MTTTNRLALALALALGVTATGCSTADPAHMGDDDGAGGDDGGGSSRPLDASGTYTMHSSFDIASNVPGTAGTVVNTIIAATDDPNDPSKWVLDQLINQLGSGVVKTALQYGEALAVGFLNSELTSIAPDFVDTMILVGKDLGDISKNFGLNETLTLTGSGTSYTATHTVTGAHFKIGNQELDFALTNYGLQNIVVDNVAVTMDSTGELTIAAHDIPLSYGQVLKMGLDGAIVPLIDPTAHNLNDLLTHLVDCNAVGSYLADDIGFLSAATYAGFCTAGLNAAAGFVYSKIDAIDGSALNFNLAGTVRGMDTNNDRQIDTLVTGSWTGMLSYGSAPSPLAPATFFGARN